MSTTRIGVVCLLVGLLAGTVQASGLVGRVTFDDGLDGLYNNSAPSHLAWTTAGDHASVSFPSSSSMPMPGEYALLAGDASVAEGAFVGNYREAGVALIGFDFKTDELIPRNGLRMEIEGPAGMISKDVTSHITSVGDWHRVRLRLDRRDASDWQPADDELFDAVLSNVQQVRVYVGRSGHSFTRTHRLDNLFVARFHRMDAVTIEDGQPAITWTELMDDANYRMEFTDDLHAGNWREEQRFFAPLDRIDWVAPAEEDSDEDAPIRFYRLVLE